VGKGEKRRRDGSLELIQGLPLHVKGVGYQVLKQILQSKQDGAVKIAGKIIRGEKGKGTNSPPRYGRLVATPWGGV